MSRENIPAQVELLINSVDNLKEPHFYAYLVVFDFHAFEKIIGIEKRDREREREKDRNEFNGGVFYKSQHQR